MISLLTNTSVNFMAERAEGRPSPHCGLRTTLSIKHLLRTNHKSLHDGVMAHSKSFLIIKWALIAKTIFKCYPQYVKERTRWMRREKHLANLFNHQASCSWQVGGYSLGNVLLKEAPPDLGSNPASPYGHWVTLDLIYNLSEALLSIFRAAMETQT